MPKWPADVVAEWEAQLDQYITDWTAAMAKHLNSPAEKNEKAKAEVPAPVLEEHDRHQGFAGREELDAPTSAVAISENPTVWRLADGWGTYYYVLAGRKAHYVAQKLEDVMAYDVDQKYDADFSKEVVSDLGMGDTAWDKKIIEVVGATPLAKSLDWVNVVHRDCILKSAPCGMEWPTCPAVSPEPVADVAPAPDIVKAVQETEQRIVQAVAEAAMVSPDVPKKKPRIKKTVVRDANGRIDHVIEEEIE